MKISVIIPTRNRLEYLKQAVASVQRQTHADWEAVVVDDASEDGTASWLAGLNDSRVRFFRFESRRERSAARNCGCNQAQGECVLFLDDDDLLRPRALEVLCQQLQRHPEAIAAVGTRIYFDENGRKAKFRLCHWGKQRVIWPEALLGWVPGQGESLIRRETFLAIGGWAEGLSVGEDHHVWLRLGRCGPIRFVPDVVCEIRLHTGQTPLPGDVREIEMRFRREFVDALPGSEKKRGLRLLSAKESLLCANREASDGRYWKALAGLLRTIWTAPELLRSPIALAALGASGRRWLMRAISGRVALKVFRPRAAG